MIIPSHVIRQAGKALVGWSALESLDAAHRDAKKPKQSLPQNATAARVIVSGILSLLLSGGIIALNWGGVGLFYEEPEVSVRPGINSAWTGPNVAALVAQIQDDRREIYRERASIAGVLGLQVGNDVADVGAGSGFLAEEFARHVGPSGRVYAVEINPTLVAFIQSRAEGQGLTNIRAHQGMETRLNLSRREGGSLDFAVLADSYHHLEYPKSMLHSMARLLRRRGQLIIIEPHRIAGQSPEAVLEHVRLGKEEVIREVTAAGFVLVDEPPAPFLKQNYILRFRKD